ncbi:tetratricopeptide repeat protein [Hyphococcus flavus]|uniref:Tetratricopeptide repeat protein n=1 Tax=Hyphococcus flavus TaxID=1866326 RepID=A0AAE9ZE76_9PROT|nr:tetratricopeptide repeat protein [Hyphococcus flavus]WDI33244.1 tetratricopeptide repeat protein [Hyphococcus flavus]
MTNEATRFKNEGRYAEAIDIMRSMVDLEPNNVAVLHNLAAVLGDAGQYRESADTLKRAFELGLNAPQSWLVYARALSGIQKFEEAQQAFFTLLRVNPVDPDAHREFAQLIWMQTGERDRALVHLNKAIEENPQNPSLHLARAQVYGQTGDTATAYAILNEAAQLSGDPYLYQMACNAALEDHKFQEAVELGAFSASALPEDVGVLSTYAMALLATDNAQSAVPIIEKLRQYAPVNQLYIALQATAWRLLKDDRYDHLYDYDAFVGRYELDTPPGWSNLDSYLDDLTEGLDQAHRFKSHPFYQSVRKGSQISSIEGADNPAMRAFRQAANGPIHRHVEAFSTGDDPLRSRNIGGHRIFSSWSISLPPQGHHVNHVHPEGWLSSACHIRLADDGDDHDKAGWLKLGEPGIATSPVLTPERFIEPERGVLVLFPSYMWHGTVEFYSGPPRLTVAVDIVPAASS